MSNIKCTIDGHNKSILTKLNDDKVTKNCNCRQPDNCPVQGECTTKSLIYQATVSTNDNRPDQTYVGLTSNTFKIRYANHKSSFCNQKKKMSTELSKYIWDLKEKKITYDIKWKILKKATAYNNTSDRCNLCLWEKFFIIYKPSLSTLNKRNEFQHADILNDFY